jgi:hypothetical protein
MRSQAEPGRAWERGETIPSPRFGRSTLPRSSTISTWLYLVPACRSWGPRRPRFPLGSRSSFTRGWDRRQKPGTPPDCSTLHSLRSTLCGASRSRRSLPEPPPRAPRRRTRRGRWRAIWQARRLHVHVCPWLPVARNRDMDAVKRSGGDTEREVPNLHRIVMYHVRWSPVLGLQLGGRKTLLHRFKATHPLRNDGRVLGHNLYFQPTCLTAPSVQALYKRYAKVAPGTRARLQARLTPAR